MQVRSLFAVALAALLVGPATAHSQARTSSKASPARATAATPTQTTTTNPNFEIGGWIGYTWDDPFGGVQLRGDFVWPFERLGAGWDLSFVGSVGLGYLSHSQSFYDPFSGTSMDLKASAWEFKLVPTARFTYTFPGDTRWSLFGDAGVGLNYTSASAEVDYGFGKQTVSSSGAGLMLRLGVGGFFRVAPRWNLGVTLDYDPSTGSDTLDTKQILVGVKYQL